MSVFSSNQVSRNFPRVKYGGVFATPLRSAADLSTYIGRFVKLDTDNRLALCGAGENAEGVLMNSPKAAANVYCDYAVGGVMDVVGGAALNEGVAVMSDANGKAVAATSGNHVLGVTKRPCVGDGYDVEIQLAVGSKVVLA